MTTNNIKLDSIIERLESIAIEVGQERAQAIASDERAGVLRVYHQLFNCLSSILTEHYGRNIKE